VVKQSETLESIARDRLGDPHRARDIAELNRDLLSEVSWLRPGMRLLLPQLPDASPRR
jgi:nucleoid-associated protein YgaU